ncbi:hypothetical protein NDA16_001649 [Ustilago loliicola]|nr:hypothetical protein NDA16_001649 [Ustilago loliicola]
MPHILKNPDGTVNFDTVKKETDFLKAKYAQNAENAKKNTAQQEQHGHASATSASSAPQQAHGDLVPPKADNAQ